MCNFYVSVLPGSCCSCGSCRLQCVLMCMRSLSVFVFICTTSSFRCWYSYLHARIHKTICTSRCVIHFYSIWFLNWDMIRRFGCSSLRCVVCTRLEQPEFKLWLRVKCVFKIWVRIVPCWAQPKWFNKHMYTCTTHTHMHRTFAAFFGFVSIETLEHVCSKLIWNHTCKRQIGCHECACKVGNDVYYCIMRCIYNHDYYIVCLS